MNCGLFLNLKLPLLLRATNFIILGIAQFNTAAMVFHDSGLLFRMNILNSKFKHYLPFLYSVLFSMRNDHAVFVMKCPSHFSNQTICLLKFIQNNIFKIWIHTWHSNFANFPGFLLVIKGGLKLDFQISQKMCRKLSWTITSSTWQW